MSSPRRPRCEICHHRFVPDPRVGGRQKVCGCEECQAARRQRTQADWRRRHPGYFVQWRAKERAALNANEPVEPPRLPPPLSRLPWEMAQEEFGVIGADFLASLGRLVLDPRERPVQPVSSRKHEGISGIPGDPAKDQTTAYLPVTKGESTEVGPGVPKDQIPAVPG